MTARRTQRVDEATLLDLLMKNDYAGFAKLTGLTVDEIERQGLRHLRRRSEGPHCLAYKGTIEISTRPPERPALRR